MYFCYAALDYSFEYYLCAYGSQIGISNPILFAKFQTFI